VSVQSTTGSRGVCISCSNGSNTGYTMFWGTVQDYWIPTPLACFPYTSPTVPHRVPSGFNWAYLTCNSSFRIPDLVFRMTEIKMSAVSLQVIFYLFERGTRSIQWPVRIRTGNLQCTRHDYSRLATDKPFQFISIINQLYAQNFCFTISLFHASIYFEHMCSTSGGQNYITRSLISSHL